MTWRDGVHLTGTPIWCDARRRRDVCFVSSVDRVGRAGHGQLIATPLTLALLGHGGTKAAGHLGVPLHRRFTLGTLRLELIASGRGPGAAALSVDIAGRGVLYAGAVRPGEGSHAAVEAAEVRACHAVVVAAPYGDEGHRFPPLADTIARTLDWARAQLANGRDALLLVDGVLEALEVAQVLRDAGLEVAASRPIRDAARRAGLALRTEPSAGKRAAPPGQIVLWLDVDHAGARRALADRPRGVALLSGRVIDGAASGDIGLPWTNAADRGQLLAWIESTTAREVFVTGRCAESIVAALGPRARVIGPPRQMALFPGEVAS